MPKPDPSMAPEASVAVEPHALGRRLADWLCAPFRRRRALREWSDLDASGRARIAHDLTMSSGDLTTVMQDGGGSAEFSQLLARTGLERAVTLSGGLHDLQRVCALCHERGDCRDWLAVPMQPGEPLGVLPSFCPNRDDLNSLRAGKARGSSAAS